MNKLFKYDEYLLEKDNLIVHENNNFEINLIFKEKIEKKKKIIMNNNFRKIENNDYLLTSKITESIENEKETKNGIFIKNFKFVENVKNNFEFIKNIFCEINTTNLIENICGFRVLNNETISLKLWNDDINNYAALTTSYSFESEFDFIIVGGGPSGIYSTFKIAQNNPQSKILLIEENNKTLEDYKTKYNNIFNWNLSQVDTDYQKSYKSNDNKTIWVGKGLGGGTLHFGLQYVNNISKNYEDWKVNNYSIIDNDIKAQKYNYDNIENPNITYNKFKNKLDNYSLNNEINVFNNPIYSNNLDNNERLLLGDLLKDLDNVSILFNTKVDKILFNNDFNNIAESVKTFDNKYFKSKNIILCSGAIETPSILQRSNIDCGNKLYDHGGILGLTYGKLDSNNNVDKELFFILNDKNLKYINQYSSRYVYSVSGFNLPNDELNNIYDFTDWSSRHPGGSYAIQKWSNNNYNLVYPHNSARWYSYKSNFIYIGKKNETINYNDLPDNIKSEELYNILINEKNKNLVDDLGFEPNKIISHLQTRDINYNWQSYYSTVPNLNNLLILTHAQSTNLEGLGKVKIISNKNENPQIILNHFGSKEEEVINNIYEAYLKNHSFLIENNYVLLNPNPLETPINKEYIKNNFDSIYHYHGSCSIGDVVDENQRVFNKNNLYIGDVSVLNKPWGGSTSYAALNTALNVSRNFISITK